MRLTKIKLAGFKSFVDPTQVSFPSNLTGVVGPNGCGKSNVIDAVRWVMGEVYANYNEVSLKRQVSRDGSSGYFINSARCRRKDITSLFLGTGLGARSYAIIEQGMISRVIEAKSDDMRAFIEEAAGISRYKERRRETENRIHETR